MPFLQISCHGRPRPHLVQMPSLRADQNCHSPRVRKWDRCLLQHSLCMDGEACHSTHPSANLGWCVNWSWDRSTSNVTVQFHYRRPNGRPHLEGIGQASLARRRVNNLTAVVRSGRDPQGYHHLNHAVNSCYIHTYDFKKFNKWCNFNFFFPFW